MPFPFALIFALLLIRRPFYELFVKSHTPWDRRAACTFIAGTVIFVGTTGLHGQKMEIKRLETRVLDGIGESCPL
ncbi:hypothetical protein VTN77DRAFT_3181 [Rasamsonia byssochlamydoides]|uniref:uncharacterized protein n=1 Tax=Rasamsonia byssochlamydoides TaxID=89139 RepID=UPI0037431B0E